MKIDSSDISLTSQHASSRLSLVEESLRAWVGPQRPNFEGGRTSNNPAGLQQTLVTISAAGRQAAANAQSVISTPPPASTPAPSGTEAASETEDDIDQTSNDPKLRFLISLIEAMIGKKIKVFNPGDLKHPHSAPPPSQQAPAAAQPDPNQRKGWGIEYDRHEIVRESEQTSFAAQGVIKTSDGQDIRFTLSVTMQREFFEETNVSIRQGDGVRKDPLVINFDGTAAQLTDTKFGFDLDSDGKAEQISFVGAGSGFLALDKNGNGTIDNGSELFGTQSGNGFADLAAYDTDANNWIDENDAIFSKLLILSKDADGKDTLSTLAQRNVGALYLGNVTTPFDLKDATNSLQGQVRASGVYLHEDGSAGTLQQIDLVV